MVSGARERKIKVSKYQRDSYNRLAEVTQNISKVGMGGREACVDATNIMYHIDNHLTW